MNLFFRRSMISHTALGFVLCLSTVWMTVADAAQLYSLITKKCEVATGLIISADENQVVVLDVKDGAPHSFQRTQIRHALVFDLIGNPYRRLEVQGRAQQELRKVFLDSSSRPTTIGWPVRFIENLVVFYDLEGKTHVYDLENIVRLRPVANDYSGVQSPKNWTEVQFDFSQASADCEQIKAPQVSGPPILRPTRILADKIKLSSFFDEFEQGFLAVNSFQERTYLYARPFLFDRASRLGFVFGDSSRLEPGTANFGAFFKWSTGRPYGFQSETAIGWVAMEHTPLIGPLGGITSAVKSHFFHGYFAGNLQNIPAGRPVISQNADTFFRNQQRAQLITSFNYLGLLGADYGPFSLSFGYFYPSFGLKLGNKAREVLGSRTSIALRGMYTANKWRAHVTGSRLKFGSNSPNQEELVALQLEDSGRFFTDTALPQQFDFQAWFVRGGFDYTFSKRFEFSVGGLGFLGDYSESASGQTNQLDFQKFGVWGRVTQKFSTYTALSVTFIQMQDDLSGNVGSTPINFYSQENSVYGSFQLLFN